MSSHKRHAVVGPEKLKSDRKNINEFIKALQEDKEKYEMFYEMAERAKFVQRSPTRVAHQEYFDRCIKP